MPGARESGRQHLRGNQIGCSAEAGKAGGLWPVKLALPVPRGPWLRLVCPSMDGGELDPADDRADAGGRIRTFWKGHWT